MTKHPRMIAAIALVTLTTVALTGCLVEKEELKKPEEAYERKSDNLRVYKPDDWIRYNVIATLQSDAITIQSGTLEVRWGNYQTLLSPDGNNYDVIKKSYLYCLDGASCTPDTIIIQYVQQDDPLINPATETPGTEKLVAMGGHPDTYQSYWLNTVGGKLDLVNGVIGGQEPVTTLTSPLEVGQKYIVKYSLMDNCTLGTSGCQSNVGTFTNTLEVVGDGTQINTNIGNYANPFQVEFTNGGVILDVDAGGQLPLTFDIFDLCTNESSTHSGRMYIIPEIGVIQLSNTCTNLITRNSIIYDITIDSISSSILSGS